MRIHELSSKRTVDITIMRFLSPRENLVTLISTHSLDAAISHELAIIVDDTFVVGECSERDHTHDGETKGIYQCNICGQIGAYRRTSWMHCLKLHVRAESVSFHTYTF